MDYSRYGLQLGGDGGGVPRRKVADGMREKKFF
jgi:hypothetical protein